MYLVKVKLGSELSQLGFLFLFLATFSEPLPSSGMSSVYLNRAAQLHAPKPKTLTTPPVFFLGDQPFARADGRAVV